MEVAEMEEGDQEAEKVKQETAYSRPGNLEVNRKGQVHFAAGSRDQLVERLCELGGSFLMWGWSM